MSDKDAAATGGAEAEAEARGEPVVRIPCQVWSRVVGFLRPIESWNVGKRQEFEDRRVYKLPTQT